MIIIIDGPDGSGKTTLAEKISKHTGYEVKHRTQPKTEGDKKRMMEDYLSAIALNEDVIFDRSWYSEMVYGPIMRDASVISRQEMYDIERKLAVHGAVIIFATGKPEDLWQRCNERGEDYVQSLEQLTEITNSFEQLMARAHYLNIVRYEI